MFNENQKNNIKKWCLENLHYDFTNYEILITALTHPSFESHKHQKTPNYERLEFLGDAVLNMVITELLIAQYPHENEGELARRRSALVCKELLSELARNLLIPDIIIMSENERNAQGHLNQNNLENCLEAIIGAINHDGGFKKVYEFIKNNWYDSLIQMSEPPKDPKSALQEWAQKNHYSIPEYNIISKTGPEHQPLFIIEVRINDKLIAEVEAKSRKIGERLAAQKLLNNIINKI